MAMGGSEVRFCMLEAAKAPPERWTSPGRLGFRVQANLTCVDPETPEPPKKGVFSIFGSVSGTSFQATGQKNRGYRKF